MGLSQINDIDLMNEKKSLNKLFECSDRLPVLYLILEQAQEKLMR